MKYYGGWATVLNNAGAVSINIMTMELPKSGK
jgi:hypothetical protein